MRPPKSKRPAAEGENGSGAREAQGANRAQSRQSPPTVKARRQLYLWTICRFHRVTVPPSLRSLIPSGARGQPVDSLNIAAAAVRSRSSGLACAPRSLASLPSGAACIFAISKAGWLLRQARNNRETHSLRYFPGCSTHGVFPAKCAARHGPNRCRNRGMTQNHAHPNCHTPRHPNLKRGGSHCERIAPATRQGNLRHSRDG